MSITVNIAQAEKYNPGESYYNLDCKLWEHVLARADELHKAAKEARDSIRTCRELEEYAESKRSLFIKSLGGIPYDNTLPLEDKVMGFVDVPGMRIEKIIFKSRPHVYVTANLYLPHKRKNPCGAVLFQLGHAADGKAYEQYQRVARSIASAGLIVMTMDPIGQGERLSYYEPSLGQFIIGPTTQEHQYAGNQCLLAGDNIARYFVADAMRAIDYLISRPEVDPAKIGATGSSGGGTATSMMMICDNRIAAAAPGTFVTNYEEYIRTGNPQDAEQIWANSASDGINHNEILLCFAPKPVMLLTADTDFFTIEGTRDVFNNSMRFWELYDKGSSLRMFTDKSQHKYTDNLAKAAAEFFSEMLNGEKRAPVTEYIASAKPEELWCTDSGQVRADYPDAKFVFEENLLRLDKKEDAASFIREKMTFVRTPEQLNLRTFDPMYESGLIITPFMWFPQRRLPNYALLFSDPFKAPKDTVICLWDRGTDDIESHMYILRRICAEGKSALVLDLSGMGKCSPHPLNSAFGVKSRFGIVFKLSKDLLCMGDSLCALRLYDLDYAIENVCAHLGLKPSIYARGNCADYARLIGKLRPELSFEIEDGVPEYSEIVRSRYYEDYNIDGILLPGIAQYI